MRKFHISCVLVGMALLVVLIWKIGPDALWRDLTLLGWGLIPFTLIEGVVDVFHTIGWRYCLTGPHRALPLWRLYGIRLSGASINYFTPTATLGGEVTKGTLLSWNHPGPEAATGVIIGKLSYALSQLLFVVLGSVIIILLGIHLPAGVLAALLIGSLLLGLGILGFLAVQKYGKLGAIVRWLVARKVGGKKLQKLAQPLTAVDEELKRFYGQRPGDLPISMLWHMAGLSCSIAKTWYFLLLMTDHGSAFMAAGIWLLGTWFDLLTFLVPIGIGVQEGTRVLAFNTLGFSLALGLTYGVALRLEQIFWGGVGILIYGTLVAGKREGGLFARKALARGEPYRES
jgi:hypothetical protein